MGKRVFFSEYLDIFHLFPQIHSTSTSPALSILSGPRDCVNCIVRFSCLKVYVGLGQWGDIWGKEEIKSEYVFSQLLLCDWVPLLKVTAPLSDFHTTFSVWVQKMLPSLDPTSLTLTSLFLQPLVPAPYPAYTLVNNPLVTFSFNPYFFFFGLDLSFPCWDLDQYHP